MTSDTAQRDAMDVSGASGRRSAPPRAAHPDTLPVLGVPVSDLSMDDAIAYLEQILMRRPRSTSHAVFFVNAHTLNLACEDPSFREVLRGAHRVFGDGTGVRWAVRGLHGHQLKDNVNGTDVVPLLFSRLAGRDLSYFLLGNTPERIEIAAAHARQAFPGWRQAGCHHGYLGEPGSPAHAEAVARINASGADMLLVGMGNPTQEQWIARHLPQLEVPLCMGIGGLFDYWVGDLVRAPSWVRRVGHEWLHLVIRQPHKSKRYVLGNPLFLARIARSRWQGTDRPVEGSGS
jgi:N-acetylglucosaminyldiphosphoundecaprenol N-acetyl-beta-D-mannosaminyltransferase